MASPAPAATSWYRSVRSRSAFLGSDDVPAHHHPRQQGDDKAPRRQRQQEAEHGLYILEDCCLVGIVVLHCVRFHFVIQKFFQPDTKADKPSYFFRRYSTRVHKRLAQRLEGSANALRIVPPVRGRRDDSANVSYSAMYRPTLAAAAFVSVRVTALPARRA